MSSRSKKLAASVRQFLRRTDFNFVSIPAVGGGGANLASTISAINDVRRKSRAAQATAVTACDIARSVCKPVDDLMRSGVRPTSGYYGGYSSYSNYAPYWSPQTALPASPVGLAQIAQTGVANGAAATRLVTDQVIETLADGIPLGG